MPATVLIVEDDREIRELLRRYLERANLLVQSTGSGAEAIWFLESAGIDLTVLDLGLPDVDGLEVLRAARADGRTVPVVVLTARDTVDDRIQGLQLGADDYVTKPFSPTELVLRVRGPERRPQPDRFTRRGRRDAGMAMMGPGHAPANAGAGMGSQSTSDTASAPVFVDGRQIGTAVLMNRRRIAAGGAAGGRPDCAGRVRSAGARAGGRGSVTSGGDEPPRECGPLLSQRRCGPRPRLRRRQHGGGGGRRHRPGDRPRRSAARVRTALAGHVQHWRCRIGHRSGRRTRIGHRSRRHGPCRVCTRSRRNLHKPPAVAGHSGQP